MGNLPPRPDGGRGRAKPPPTQRGPGEMAPKPPRPAAVVAGQQAEVAFDPVAAALTRLPFYRENAHRVTKLLLASFGLNALLAMAVIVLAFREPEPRYFATRADGGLLPMVPLHTPIMADAAVLDWGVRAVLRANTYDFANYRQQFRTASEDFTAAGWREFERALEQSGNFQAVLAKRLVATAVSTNAAVLTGKGAIDGAFQWRFQFPAAINYQSASEVRRQCVMVTALVQRVATLEKPSGIGLVQVVMRPETSC